MTKRPGLAVYLASRRLRGKARAEAQFRERTAAGTEDAARVGERLGKPDIARPEGPLVWLHAGQEGEALGFPELIDRLMEERDDLNFLVTTSDHDPEHPLGDLLPASVIQQHLPYDYAAGAEAFVAHWRPDLCLWSENRFHPGVLNAAASAGTDLILFDARVPERPGGFRWLPGIRRSLLSKFSHVLAGDDSAAKGLAALGIEAERLETVGFLQEGSAPLPCSQAERDMLAEDLQARPVWLAAGVTTDEFEMVERLHQQVMRRAHRLLMIVVPDDPAGAPALADHLEAEGWVVGRRWDEDEMEPDVEVYVGDDPEDFGLWYRLAPISFIGGTMATGARRNPYEAAALGSAVIYGPNPGRWRESFERLRDAGAARQILDPKDFGRALEQLLAPDKVAQMATAAWEVTTNGAEATDRLVELVMTSLDQRRI